MTSAQRHQLEVEGHFVSWDRKQTIKGGRTFLLHVKQKAGGWDEVLFRTHRQDPTVPVKMTSDVSL